MTDVFFAVFRKTPENGSVRRGASCLRPPPVPRLQWGRERVVTSGRAGNFGGCKKELNRGRREIRETKVYRVVDAVDAGFPGARTIIRTYREVWQTRKTGRKDKCGRGVRKAFGKPTKEVAYHVSSLDPDSQGAERFAEMVRTHWHVEAYHGKRDNGYHEDAFTRRCDENVMAAMMVARSFGMWICARRPGRTTEQVKNDLNLHPAKLVRIMMKGGLQ